MAKAKKSKPESPIVSPRERELLNDLELLKSQGVRITIAGFARRNGYANKSALRHFQVLLKDLRLYVAQFSVGVQHQQSQGTVKYLESQLERQNRLIARLQTKVKTIPERDAKIAKLEQRVKRDEHQKKVLRGMLSTCISFLSSSDFAKARNLSERLEKQARVLMEDDQGDPSSSAK